MAQQPVKTTLQVILIIMGTSLSMVSVISGISVGQLFSRSDNIDVQEENRKLDYASGSLQIPMRINNQGFYDINDLRVDYNITLVDSSGNPVQVVASNGVAEVGNFPGRQDRNATIDMMFTVPETPLDQLVAAGTRMRLDMRITGKYALDLMDFAIAFNRTIDLSTV
ncbi:MAG: hypothetical protein ACTSU5_14380 [Promethearchaeota archaeon]